jgi:hypothetical protein
MSESGERVPEVAANDCLMSDDRRFWVTTGTDGEWSPGSNRSYEIDD